MYIIKWIKGWRYIWTSINVLILYLTSVSVSKTRQSVCLSERVVGARTCAAVTCPVCVGLVLTLSAVSWQCCSSNVKIKVLFVVVCNIKHITVALLRYFSNTSTYVFVHQAKLAYFHNTSSKFRNKTNQWYHKLWQIFFHTSLFFKQSKIVILCL